MPPDEPKIETREESRYDQSDEELASNGDSVVHSPRRKWRRRLTRKEKGKKKVSEKVSDSSTDKNELDQRESDSEETGDGSSMAKYVSAEKTSTSANERVRRSTCKMNPVVRFGYNEYKAHYYAYMTHVADYVEAAKDAN